MLERKREAIAFRTHSIQNQQRRSDCCAGKSDIEMDDSSLGLNLAMLRKFGICIFILLRLQFHVPYQRQIVDSSTSSAFNKERITVSSILACMEFGATKRNSSLAKDCIFDEFSCFEPHSRIASDGDVHLTWCLTCQIKYSCTRSGVFWTLKNVDTAHFTVCNKTHKVRRKCQRGTSL